MKLSDSVYRSIFLASFQLWFSLSFEYDVHSMTFFVLQRNFGSPVGLIFVDFEKTGFVVRKKTVHFGKGERIARSRGPLAWLQTRSLGKIFFSCLILKLSTSQWPSVYFRLIFWVCIPGTWLICLRHLDWTLSLIEHQVHMLNMMNFGRIWCSFGCGGGVSGSLIPLFRLNALHSSQFTLI